MKELECEALVLMDNRPGWCSGPHQLQLQAQTAAQYDWEALCALCPSLLQMEEFQIYEKYCQNKPRSESLWRQCSDCPFFQVCLEPLLHTSASFLVALDRALALCDPCLVLPGVPEEAGPQAEP